ncbi:MAG TPA: hypothetical protein VG248_17450 [Caulobacteraceae bacterium]|nr:hypothetical protein [Caulobacteraceae bacterium]
MSAAETAAAEPDRARILHRLEHAFAPSGVCGFYHPDDAALLRQMSKEGLVECWWGEGHDRSVMLAKLRPESRAAGVASPSRPGGAA